MWGGGMTWVMVDRDRDAIFSLYWTSFSLSLLLIHPANPVEGKGISFTVTRSGSTPGDESRAVFCVSCFEIYLDVGAREQKRLSYRS